LELKTDRGRNLTWVLQAEHVPEGCAGFDKEFEMSDSRLLLARSACPLRPPPPLI
jgi:hypothetical protein